MPVKTWEEATSYWYLCVADASVGDSSPSLLTRSDKTSQQNLQLALRMTLGTRLMSSRCLPSSRKMSPWCWTTAANGWHPRPVRAPKEICGISSSPLLHCPNCSCPWFQIALRNRLSASGIKPSQSLSTHQGFFRDGRSEHGGPGATLTAVRGASNFQASTAHPCVLKIVLKGYRLQLASHSTKFSSILNLVANGDSNANGEEEIPSLHGAI